VSWRGGALRSALWLLLGGWVGAWVLFGAVVSRVAFRVLPSPELAGSLVGPVLETLHLYGGFAGVALALLAAALGRGPVRIALPLLMAGLCLYSHFGVTAEIAEIRGRVFGPEGSLELAARFSRLHRLSVALFVFVGACSMLLLGLHAHAEAREASPRV
jgi:hypothetical protein